MKIPSLLALTAAFALNGIASADLVFKDDTGQEVRLKAPAKRIVALAPHIAESLYAAGAGDRLVGTVDYSDYPPEAKKLPRIGGYSRVDLEAVAALKPDLVLAWESGNNMPQVDKLKGLGLTVYVAQPNKMENVADHGRTFPQTPGKPARRQRRQAQGSRLLPDLENPADDGWRPADHQRCDQPVRRHQRFRPPW